MKREHKKPKKYKRREESPPPLHHRESNQLHRQIQDDLEWLDEQEAYNEIAMRDLRD